MAQFGTKEDVIRAAENLEARANELREIEERVLGGYVAGEGPFPDRMHLIGVIGKFLHDYRKLLADYSSWVRATVETWDGTETAEAYPDARRLLEDLLADR